MSFTTAGGTGGEYNHTLSVGEMPRHNHNIDIAKSSTESSAHGLATGAVGFAGRCMIASSANKYSTISNGSGNSHNNIQPYIIVYFWRRTA